MCSKLPDSLSPLLLQSELHVKPVGLLDGKTDPDEIISSSQRNVEKESTSKIIEGI